MKTIFWISLFIIFYTYIGYGILLYGILKIRNIFIGKKKIPANKYTPSLTVIVAAYNEEDIIEEKISNTLALDYPIDRIYYLFITDGSTDNTYNIISKYLQIKLMHKDGRSGKIAAIHRAMQEVNTDIVVFTDANTFLNKEALLKISRHYANPKIGAVSGEKRVEINEVSDATAGEGFYWKYESTLKKWDSELYSVVGAAGELFSIRTDLYQAIPPNSLLDDFMISMLIAKKGYKIIYEPEAYAIEKSSVNTKEELKRKVRIAAGGIQSIIWLKSLLLPFSLPILSFQYISHRVLRWTITPFLMILALLLNVWIVTHYGEFIYKFLLYAQCLFYALSLVGWLFEKNEIKIKIFFIPFYFCLMNYAVIAGIFRFAFTAQTGIWEKAKRK